MESPFERLALARARAQLSPGIAPMVATGYRRASTPDWAMGLRCISLGIY